MSHFLEGELSFSTHRPDDAYLSDSNKRLIELYIVIRDNLEEFVEILKEHNRYHSNEYYYEIRAKKLQGPTPRAAQFLYLNRTCWNGLYRENINGEFNVPIGTKQTVIFDSDDFPAWAQALSSVRLECLDFEQAIDRSTERDFVFVDPPYTVRHNMNGFVRYNRNIFAWKDQVRLRDTLQRAAKRGVLFAMTNADHRSIRDLYAGFGKHRSLARHSVIAGQSTYRLRSTELLVTG